MVPIVALVIIAIGAASTSIAHAQPKPLTVADAIALAQLLTDGDSRLKSVEIRGSYRFGVPTRFSYWYEAPGTYEGLTAVDDPKATYIAAINSRAIFYDPRQGQLLEFTDVVPGIQAIIQNDNLRVAYSFSKRTATSTQPPPGVIIDIPAIVRDRRLTKQDLQPLPAGKYRLVLTDQTGYTSVAATIDTTQDIAYADIEISVNQRTLFVEMHINRAPSISLPRIATPPELRAFIGVQEAVLPSGLLPWLSTLTALQLLTPAVIVPSQRQGLEGALGEKPNWAELEANLRRDIPKLQQALPLP